MELFFEGRASRLTVEVADSELIMYPSLNLFVTVSDEGFCEARSYVWVTVPDYTDFVMALRQCEQTQRGRAVLSGMSPNEFELVIESSDSLGHFRLRYKLERISSSWGTWQEKMVSGGFELSSEFIAKIATDFAELLPDEEETMS